MFNTTVFYFVLLAILFLNLESGNCREYGLHTYIETFGGVSLGFAEGNGDVESEKEAFEACRYARTHNKKQRELVAKALEKDKSARHFQSLYSVAMFYSGTSVALALYFVWKASYATECVRQFRAIIEFRRRYEDCINTLESRISVQEIDFTYRRRAFVYPGDVAVPANMQTNDAPIHRVSRRRGNEDTSFPSVNADEEENLEGRTDFHAFERAAADVKLHSVRRWKIRFIFASGVISLIIQVIFCVGTLFVDMSNIGDVFVRLCKLELEAHINDKYDCRPHLNAQTMENLDTLISWRRSFASEKAWSQGVLSFSTIFTTIITLGSYYHGSKQLLDNTPKKNIHMPREHFYAYVFGAFGSWVALVFQLTIGYIFLSEYVSDGIELEKCVAKIYGK